VQKQFGGDGGDNEAERSQRPHQTDIALGEQVKQTAEENRLEENAQQNIAVGGAARHHPADFGHGDLLQFSNLFEPGA